MKKWLIIFVVAVIFSIPILSGCGADTDIKSQEYIVATDMVKYNLHGIEDFGFNVNLISRNKDIDVEFWALRVKIHKDFQCSLMMTATKK